MVLAADPDLDIIREAYWRAVEEIFLGMVWHRDNITAVLHPRIRLETDRELKNRARLYVEMVDNGG